MQHVLIFIITIKISIKKTLPLIDYCTASQYFFWARPLSKIVSDGITSLMNNASGFGSLSWSSLPADTCHTVLTQNSFNPLSWNELQKERERGNGSPHRLKERSGYGRGSYMLAAVCDDGIFKGFLSIVFLIWIHIWIMMHFIHTIP